MKVVNENILHPIDYLCKEVGISRYRLAKNMGVAYSTIQSLVSRNSNIDNIDVGTLLKISNAVNLTLDETYAKLKSYEQPKYKVRWTNGWGDEDGNIYPYRFYLEINGKKTYVIPNEIMNKFMNEHSNFVNGIGTNMFRGQNEKELTEKLVQTLKENGII